MMAARALWLAGAAGASHADGKDSARHAHGTGVVTPVSGLIGRG